MYYAVHSHQRINVLLTLVVEMLFASQVMTSMALNGQSVPVLEDTLEML